jgi:hypothetical protein
MREDSHRPEGLGPDDGAECVAASAHSTTMVCLRAAPSQPRRQDPARVGIILR